MSSIKFVIETVYKASFELCNKYEAEAARFCGSGVTLKRGTYLPRYNNRFVTFKQRVKELHINHLTLYRTFIENNYNFLKISESNMKELTDRDSGFISKYIAKYDNWKTEEGAPECF